MTVSFTRVAGALAAAAVVSLAAVPARATDPAVNCQAAKLKQLGKYAKCRLFAESLAKKKAIAPDFFRCDNKFLLQWSRVEANAGGACPTQGDAGQVQDAFTHEADRFALWLSGTDPLGASRMPASGQTTAYPADKNDGVPGAVSVPDDGTLKAGAALSYVDNGDGTISDLVTGLMWEKKSDDGGLHDKDKVYRWSGDGTQETIWDWLDDVNAEGGTGFAAYSDWRIPNVKELASISNHENFAPAVSPVFHTGCAPGCTVTTCSCNGAEYYWSASSDALGPPATLGWGLNFFYGNIDLRPKTFGNFVRAVRGGL